MSKLPAPQRRAFLRMRAYRRLIPLPFLKPRYKSPTKQPLGLRGDSSKTEESLLR